MGNVDTLDQGDIDGSVISQTVIPSIDGDPSLWGNQIIPLVRWKSVAKRARSMRITFPAVRCADGRQPGITDPAVSPFPAANEFATAGPPPNTPIMAYAAWLRLTWGVGGAQSSELLSQYPFMGSAVDLVADHVACDLFFANVFQFPASLDQNAMFGAAIGPADKVEATNFGLGVSRVYTVAQAAAATIAVPPFARTMMFQVTPAAIDEAAHTGLVGMQLVWVDPIGVPSGFVSYGTAGFSPGAVLVQPIPRSACALQITGPNTMPNLDFSIDWRISP